MTPRIPRFDVALHVRDDGVKTWIATCLGCGASMVGDCCSGVVILQMNGVPSERLKEARRMISEAITMSQPILFDSSLDISHVPDGNSLLNALEEHSCE